MSVLVKRAVVVVVVLLAPVVLFKVAQKICWDNQLSVLAPPSLDSWDPTERVEAARRAAKQFGGKP